MWASGLCLVLMCGAAALDAAAQKPASTPVAPASVPQRGSSSATSASSAAPMGGEPWSSLTAAQRSVLEPLQHEWPQLPPGSKQKWIEMAARYPSLPEADRTRIRERMAEWARMSPQERSQARLHFQQSRKLTPQERHEKWQEYQSLPPVERQQLANTPSARPEAPHKAEARSGKEASREHPQSKSNVVPNDLAAAPPKTVSPSVVQAKPGATTNLMSRPSAPPTHQQPGLPKIAATPMLVDRVTLLPRRGSQGAGVREAAAASTPASAPKRP